LDETIRKILELRAEYEDDYIEEEEDDNDDACYMELDDGTTLIDPKSVHAFEGLKRENVITDPKITHKYFQRIQL